MKRLIYIFIYCFIVLFACLLSVDRVNAADILTCGYEWEDQKTNIKYKAFVSLDESLRGINVIIDAKGKTQEKLVENAYLVKNTMAENLVCPKYALFLERKTNEYIINLYYDVEVALRAYNNANVVDQQFLLINTLYKYAKSLIDNHKELEKLYQEYIDASCDFSFKIDTEECVAKKNELEKLLATTKDIVNQAIDAGLPADHYTVTLIKEFELKYENMRITEPEPDPEPPKKPDENGGTSGTYFCKDPGVQATLYIIAILIFILKILIPILLIIFASIDFAKAIVAAKEDALQGAAKALGTRAIAGIIIFLLPTVLNAIFSLVDEYSKKQSTFIECTNCLWNPSACDKTKFTGKSE